MSRSTAEDLHGYEELHLPEDFKRMETYDRRAPVIIQASRSKETSGCSNTAKWVVIVIMGLAVAGLLATVLYILLRKEPDSGATSPTAASAGTMGGTNKGVTTPAAPPSPQGYVDCGDVYRKGHRTSGVYTISPDGQRQMDVYCEQSLDGGGWTVFQRRINGRVDFYRNWNEYKIGFGDVTAEFWLGNDNIHALTAGRGQKLKIEMKDVQLKMYLADYTEFYIRAEDDDYRLRVKGYDDSGITGGFIRAADAMRYHDEFRFTTKDVDNDRHQRANCAVADRGGWWYDYCHRANLNGVYNGTNFEGIIWFPITGNEGSLLAVRMMVKTF